MVEMRGWLNGLIEGTIGMDEVESIIYKRINDSVKRGYEYGYIDGRIKRLEGVQDPTRCDLTPFGISALERKKKGLEGAL